MGRFYPLPIVNNVAMKISIRVPVSFLLGSIPGSGVAASYGKSMFNFFLRSCQTAPTVPAYFLNKRPEEMAPETPQGTRLRDSALHGAETREREKGVQAEAAG